MADTSRDPAQRLGLQLKAIRVRSGWKQLDLAEEASVPIPVIRALETQRPIDRTVLNRAKPDLTPVGLVVAALSAHLARLVSQTPDGPIRATWQADREALPDLARNIASELMRGTYLSRDLDAFRQTKVSLPPERESFGELLRVARTGRRMSQRALAQRAMVELRPGRTFHDARVPRELSITGQRVSGLELGTVRAGPREAAALAAGLGFAPGSAQAKALLGKATPGAPLPVGRRVGPRMSMPVKGGGPPILVQPDVSELTALAPGVAETLGIELKLSDQEAQEALHFFEIGAALLDSAIARQLAVRDTLQQAQEQSSADPAAPGQSAGPQTQQLG